MAVSTSEAEAVVEVEVEVAGEVAVAAVDVVVEVSVKVVVESQSENVVHRRTGVQSSPEPCFGHRMLRSASDHTHGSIVPWSAGC